MRIALVHDYLTQYGGAERVLDALKGLYPDAPIFTSLVDYSALPDHYRDWEIHASPLKILPGVKRYHRGLLPLYPPAFGLFRRQLRAFDVVLSDSSAWSHHARGGSDALHLCYCHSPARFLHRDPNYLAPARVPLPLRPLLPPVLAGLRALDRNAAQRVDHYIANSRAVADRIAAAYGRDACVIYPPVETERFTGEPPTARGDYYLIVSRLVPHKRVDLAVEACTRAGLPLKVVGTGRAFDRLQPIAGSTVELLGWRNDDEIADLLRGCRAFILPGAEDFGITAVEAQAAGRPVIAYAAGGALESVIDGATGLFFDQPSAESLLDAIHRLDRISWSLAQIQENAQRFNRTRFQQEIAHTVRSLITRHDSPSPEAGEEAGR